jgi:UDP-N-acetylmuramyl pentapeptide phosphotransferase/UDP-N-acetylglucosamine-1-phosphate transferase
MVIFIITAVSNGANITDGLDGLASGTSAIIGVCLGIFAYASGNFFLADYLNIMYIPNLGEAIGFHCRNDWSLYWLHVVQRLPRTGVYGRHRQLKHWGAS